MTKLAIHIENLLYLHDCVIIPGFGAFIGSYSEAHTEDSTAQFFPPSKTVGFNKQLKQDDGLLTAWIAEKEGIRYEIAQKRVAHLVEELNVRLNRRETLSLGSIGTFRLDRRFHLIFEPGTHNFLPESLGMNPVIYSPVEKNTKGIAVPYVSTENTWVGRLLKYGLSAAAITGIIIITQLDIFRTGPAMEASVQPGPRPLPAEEKKPAIVSPECDYVDFDPWCEIRQESPSMLND